MEDLNHRKLLGVGSCRRVFLSEKDKSLVEKIPIEHRDAAAKSQNRAEVELYALAKSRGLETSFAKIVSKSRDFSRIEEELLQKLNPEKEDVSLREEVLKLLEPLDAKTAGLDELIDMLREKRDIFSISDSILSFLVFSFADIIDWFRSKNLLDGLEEISDAKAIEIFHNISQNINVAIDEMLTRGNRWTVRLYFKTKKTKYDANIEAVLVKKCLVVSTIVLRTILREKKLFREEFAKQFPFLYALGDVAEMSMLFPNEIVLADLWHYGQWGLRTSEYAYAAYAVLDYGFSRETQSRYYDSHLALTRDGKTFFAEKDPEIKSFNKVELKRVVCPLDGSKAIVKFFTEYGSEYCLTDTGKSQRIKLFEDSSNDIGLHEWSDLCLFVDYATVERLWNTRNENQFGSIGMNVYFRNGKISSDRPSFVSFVSKTTGEWIDVAPSGILSTIPIVGLHPLEICVSNLDELEKLRKKRFTGRSTIVFKKQFHVGHSVSAVTWT